MPLHDGTGPFGAGPGTGRKRGRCVSGCGLDNAGRILFRNRGGWFGGIMIPVAVAAIRDLTNPSGFLWQIVRGALSYKKKMERRIVHDAHYIVIDEKSDIGASVLQQSNRGKGDADART